MLKTLVICAGLAASSAQASELVVTFADGAPKDRFQLINGGCALSDVTVTIDLTQTPAGLIFDVTASGAGVEVYQPVEVTAGSLSVSPVSDGGQILALGIADFPIGSTYSLTADLDDTVSGRQITVNGSEMLGAVVRLQTSEVTITAPFDNQGRAMLDLANAGVDCPIT